MGIMHFNFQDVSVKNESIIPLLHVHALTVRLINKYIYIYMRTVNDSFNYVVHTGCRES